MIDSAPSCYLGNMKALLTPALLLPLALAALTGCPDPEEGDGTDENGETGDTEESDTSDTETGSTEESDTGNTEESDTGDTETGDTETGDTEGGLGLHGGVKIEPTAADPSVFDGTTEVVATVTYLDCLRAFYMDDHPELAQGQPEGDAVLAAWADELCDPARENNIACTVTGIEQSLIEAVEVYNLRVTFEISDPASLPGGWIYVGPIPTPEAAGCPDPSVELLQSGLIGRSSGGATLWEISTLPADNTATADQAAPLLVTVVPPN